MSTLFKTILEKRKVPLPDKVVIYDEVSTAAISAGNSLDLASLDAAEKLLAIEEAWIWPPYYAGAPDDLDEIRILIDGEPFPNTRLHIRCKGERNMARPRDSRWPLKPMPFGKVSNNPLEDTCIKVLPAGKLAVRLMAGASTGVRVNTTTRVMLVGRVFRDDVDLRRAYGSIYQPMGPFSLTDIIGEKTTPDIDKQVPVSIDNAKYFSGSPQQKKPRINPWWNWAQNYAEIPATPEYSFSFEPRHVDKAFQDLIFNWTRLTDKALLFRHIGAIIDAGRGKVWFFQDPRRRPGVDLTYYGWVVDADYPHLLPPGTDPVHHHGPIDLAEITPQILAHNNLVELRATADAGTTITANDLELQLRGTYIEW